MSATPRRFSHEFKHELCREVTGTSKPIIGVAELEGAGAKSVADQTTLRPWLRQKLSTS